MHHVLVASPHRGLVQYVRSRPDVVVVATSARADAVAELSRGGYRLAILHEAATGAPGTADWLRQALASAAGAICIYVPGAGPLAPETAEALKRQGLRVARLEGTRTDLPALVDAALRAERDEPRDEPRAAPRSIAVWAPAGGGATTVALSLAQALRVPALDWHLRRPAFAGWFPDLERAAPLEVALEGVEEGLTADHLRAMSRTMDGLTLVRGLADWDRAGDVTRAHAEALWALADAHLSRFLVDAGTGLDTWLTYVALDRAERVIVVLGGHLPALRSAQQILSRAPARWRPKMRYVALGPWAAHELAALVGAYVLALGSPPRPVARWEPLPEALVQQIIAGAVGG